MTAIQLKIKVNVDGFVKRMREGLKKPVDFSTIASMALTEVQKNFDLGGRYKTKEAAKEGIGGDRRWRRRKRDYPHRTLIKSGALRNRIYKTKRKKGFTLWSRLPYSRAQNLGNPSRKLPARPFLVLHPATIKRFSSITKKQIIKNYQ